jgi:hypothetical protein
MLFVYLLTTLEVKEISHNLSRGQKGVKQIGFKGGIVLILTRSAEGIVELGRMPVLAIEGM